MNILVEHELIVSFPDQSETFTLGFEAGMFWQRTESGESTFKMTIHHENTEVMRRMAVAKGLAVAYCPSSVIGWTEIEVTTASTRPALRLINGGITGGRA